MTLRTSIVGNNLAWSSSSSWADNTVPLDNDTFLIPVNSNVIFDVNMDTDGLNFATEIIFTTIG